MDVLGLKGSNPSIPPQKVSHAHPYASSISSSASSSSSSIFSLDGVSSQSAISSTSTNPIDVIWENESASQTGGRGLSHSSESSSRCLRPLINGLAPKVTDAPVPPELRKHPRRTTNYVVQSNGVPCVRPPPCLVRQSERKVNFVDSLVDSASQIVEIIWPLSAVSHRADSTAGSKGVLPLRTFIQETLRRSRTSYSTLQVALYYLIKIKPHVREFDSNEQPRERSLSRAMQCGRRMFLAALILASKYLQDRNYSARAWSKISGLNTTEINQNELLFLDAVQWKLHIPEATYHRWTSIVLKLTQGAGGPPRPDGLCWRTAIPKLTPELDTIDVEPANPFVPSFGGFDFESLTPRSPPTGDPSSLSSSAGGQAPSYPRNIPVTLEPTPRMDYPTSSFPSVPRPPMLPTPQLTNQSSLASTPAAGVGAYVLRRTSIGAAMTQAQNICMARSTLDQRPPTTFCAKANSFDGFPTLIRRSSLARSNSSMSSPESMVSDVSTVSSRSSRSSSISSSASGPCAPVQARLAVQATRRCANSLKDCRKNVAVVSPTGGTTVATDVYESPESCKGVVPQMPDFSGFSLGTPIDLNASTQEAARSLCELSGAVSVTPQNPEPTSYQASRRKRGRTGSEDLSLQLDVRRMINSHATKGASILPDGNLADSFLLGEQKPHCVRGAPRLSTYPRIALSGPVGTKRACCGSETRQVALNPNFRVEFAE